MSSTISDPQETLSFLCTLDPVSLSCFENSDFDIIGNGRLLVLVTSPDNPSQAIVLRFFDDDDQECAFSVLEPQTKIWLQQQDLLMVPRHEGGFWRFDFSASDQETFCTFQDMLTLFLRYQNRHNIRNALVMIDAESCKLTQVIAKDIYLQGPRPEDSQAIIDEKMIDKKLPMVVQRMDEIQTIGIDPLSKARVRTMYRTGDALVTGSNWLASALIYAGKTVAREIESRTTQIETTAEPSNTALNMGDNERYCLDVIHQGTGIVQKATASWLSSAFSATISGISNMYTDESLASSDPVQSASRHLGISTLHAATAIASGAAIAAGTILASSGKGVVQVIKKKYVLPRGKPSVREIPRAPHQDVLVYFDGNGMSRQVVVQDDPDNFSWDQLNSDERSENEYDWSRQEEMSQETGDTVELWLDSWPLPPANESETSYEDVSCVERDDTENNPLVKGNVCVYV
ncbi:hypothetical protein J3Q64DRAFT_1829379 [Phycomyces blakesleeanus]|uniref:Senescence domain-containing protein n=2 Tax=Phycomyces blakesleeanus TaxID=4837 RepID=A0A167QMD5_PHYB8|nr:hypothetical protein PHYBLDRAFT_162973 [Phycomyces blakesleeanus NRRL 1555(-)]OAD79921.1 hypothetical protein PHYBLDRAFT_162973 [Phycomyces blakesleeanus NRRL 1555(-)]|eukprot:XP_018297961.1 hypothetical protein PHYBLDRAFT_162973 [Phycomyces blakesleeanus NRRL 1555(-)]